MTLHLSQTAFLSVTLSSIEAYKKECYGIILGHRTDTSWVVEYALPYQTADRGHKMVVPHGLRDRRVRACLAQLSSFEHLGTFHSHPAWGSCRALARPSATDIATMQPGELDLIIAVNDARRPAKFRYGSNGRTLSGTVCNFALTMAAFYRPPLDDHIRRVSLRCPYALGFEPDIASK